MDDPRSVPPSLPRSGSASPVFALGCAVAAFVAGLPFAYVGSFIVFLHVYPILGPTTCKSIEPFYWPLIWLSFQVQATLYWALQA